MAKRAAATVRGNKADPRALSIEEAARLLSAAGGPTNPRISEDMIRADVKSGAPTNENGTVNLLHYTAWLARESK